MSKFRAGDRVICISAHTADFIELGNEYTIVDVDLDVRPDNSVIEYVTIYGHSEQNFEYNSSRFELVERFYSTDDAREFANGFKWVNNKTATLIRQLADRIDKLEGKSK
jgi:hypothetical protein